jgi:acetamidase/formamidase
MPRLWSTLAAIALALSTPSPQSPKPTIETSLRGRLQLIVHKGMTLAWPRAETKTDYISMGTDEDLTKATKIAIQEMVDFLVATKDSTRSRPIS